MRAKRNGGRKREGKAEREGERKGKAEKERINADRVSENE